jgi:putative SOS response-associated peptidase YedK
MCARYTMATSPDELIEEFEATLVADAIEPHWNIAPTQMAPIVIATKDGERRIGLSRFGLVPHWADDVKIGTRLLNARIETAADKAAFRDAFARHRCLVIADGFYEWQREGKVKTPHLFRLPDAGPFGLAGLWAIWNAPDGEKLSSFSILTRPAVGPVARIHDRMPIVLARDAYGAWLDRARTEADDVLAIAEQQRGDELHDLVVSRAVNDVKNDDPKLVDPV